MGGLGLWLLAWRLDTHFAVILWMYVSQMLAILPPRRAIPAATLLLGTFWGFEMAWDLTRLSPSGSCIPFFHGRS